MMPSTGQLFTTNLLIRKITILSNAEGATNTAPLFHNKTSLDLHTPFFPKSGPRDMIIIPKYRQQWISDYQKHPTIQNLTLPKLSMEKDQGKNLEVTQANILTYQRLTMEITKNHTYVWTIHNYLLCVPLLLSPPTILNFYSFPPDSPTPIAYFHNIEDNRMHLYGFTD